MNFWNSTEFKHEKHNYDFVKDCGGDDQTVVSLDTVKKFIDQILEFPKTKFFKEYITIKDRLLVDFIGGDSLRYPQLIDESLTYLLKRLLEVDSEWKFSWRASVSSNGVTLLDPVARKVCEKWKDFLSLGVSIDGNPELHDLNRWCFANEEDGSHRGSWKYIMNVWPWYKENFPDDACSTKWTVVPASYKYLYDSVKYLHEELGMTKLNFNRVMEDDVIDTPRDVWEAVGQFQKILDYVVKNHTSIYVLPFDYERFALSKAYDEQSKLDPTQARCGFGKMPTVTLDGRIYPCFRMIPGHNGLKDPTKYAQGHVDTSLVDNYDLLTKINDMSSLVNMRIPDKCKVCKVFSSCQHCCADCLLENEVVFKKTTSICNYHRIEVYFARLYWETVITKYPKTYRNYKVTWTHEDQDELLGLVLKDVLGET